MKKILIVAALFAAWSCSTADQDLVPSISGDSSKVSVTLSTAQGVQSRVALSEDAQSGDLQICWAENDALGAWSTGVAAFTKFTMVDQSMSSNGETATFTGSISGDTFRLVHPYTTTSISSDSFVLDLSEQSVDMSDSSLSYMSESTYMISPEIEVALESIPLMQHIGSSIKVGMRFMNLAEGDLEIKSVELSGVATSAIVDLSEEVTSDEFLSSQTQGSILLSVDNSPVVENYSSDQTYSVIFNALPFSVVAGGSLDLEVVLASGSITYTKSFSVDLSEGLDLARASYITINKVCDMTDAEIYAPGSLEFLFSTDGDSEGWYTKNAVATTMSVSGGYMNLDYDWDSASSGYCRADIYYDNPVLDANNYPILAIKWSDASVLSTFRLHSNLGSFMNTTTNKYTGKVGDDVFYYNLADGLGTTVPTADTEISYIDWIATMKTDSYLSTSVDWIKTFASVDEMNDYIDATSDDSDSGDDSGDADYTNSWMFASAEDTLDWVITTANSTSSKGELEVTEEGLKVTYTTSSSSARLDLRNSNLTFSANHPILAIKCDLPTGAFRLHSNLGNFNNNSGVNYTGSVDTDGRSVYYYDLSNGFANALGSVPTSLTYLNWITTNSSSDGTSYIMIEWIRDFASVEALEAYLAE